MDTLARAEHRAGQLPSQAPGHAAKHLQSTGWVLPRICGQLSLGDELLIPAVQSTLHPGVVETLDVVGYVGSGLGGAECLCGGLVTLRNTLVHHLLDRHDIWTIQGCHNAQHFLTNAYAEVDKHIEQLRTLAGYMDATRAAAAELMQTPEFLDMVVNGISPEGQIHWPSAGIVSVLRQANRELAVDGWCNLDAGARWVSENHPEQTPQKYGCSRWRHAVHQSGEFELRRFTHNGQFGAWFRERPASSR